MKSIDFDLLNQRIEQNRKKAEREILIKKKEKSYNRKSRNEDEKKILDILTKKNWEKAMVQGKVRYISERVMFYDFD